MSFGRYLVPVVVLTLASSAAAQQKPQTADEKEVVAYVLTMDTLNRVMRATKAMYQEMMKDPRFKQVADIEAEIAKLEEKSSKLDDGLPEAEQERLDALRQKKEELEDNDDSTSSMSNAKTLSEMEAAVRKMPGLVPALQREGLSPREYAKFWIAFWTSGMAYGFQKAGYGSKDANEMVNPANLKFFAEHEKEIEALQKEFEALGKPKQ